jgi:hypothetical protein
MLVQALSYNTQKLKVGIFYQGGIIVYVNSSIKQGLIAATADITGGAMPWQTGDYTTITTSNTYGQGLQNTINIDAAATTTPAATACLNYTLNGYDDWFLPNQTELLLLKSARTFVPGLSNTVYWTSWSNESNTARMNDFNPTTPYSPNGQVNGFRCCGLSSPGPGGLVRACRYITFT